MQEEEEDEEEIQQCPRAQGEVEPVLQPEVSIPAPMLFPWPRVVLAGPAITLLAASGLS